VQGDAESLGQLLAGEAVRILSDESDVVRRELGPTSYRAAVLERAAVVCAAMNLQEAEVVTAEALSVVRLAAALNRT
jgi:hypothetical protein